MHNIDVTDIGKSSYTFENVDPKVNLELRETLRDADILWTDTEEEIPHMGNTGENELGDAKLLVDYDEGARLLSIEFANDDVKRFLRQIVEARMIDARRVNAQKEGDALVALYDSLPILPPEDMID